MPASVGGALQEGRQFAILEAIWGDGWGGGKTDVANFRNLVEAEVEGDAFRKTREETPGDNLTGVGSGGTETLAVVMKGIVPFESSARSSH